MKQTMNTIALIMLLCVCGLWTQDAFAQGYGDPLRFQGITHTTSPSVASRGAGGSAFGRKNDVSLMFLNPASLSSLGGIQVSVGGLQQSSYWKQEQHYGGLQDYAAFSPLVEGTTNQLTDPYSGTYPDTLKTQADSVQRPFDGIGPGWNTSKSKSLPVQVQVAMPFTLGAISVVGGVGVVQYANLNWYYQNNNCLSPSVLSFLNGTILEASLNSNPYAVQWYQYSQQREGSIYGYGAALSAAMSPQLSVGISALMLKGSTDDTEVRVGRGRMLFFASSLRLDRPGTTSYQKTGTSDYSGAEFSLAAEYTGRYFNVGFSVKPPTTITRSFTTTFTQDSVALSKRFLSKVDSVTVHSSGSYSGEDKIELPWRGSFGFGLNIREDLSFNVSYEIRSYTSAQYSAPDGSASNPWLSCSILHLGAELQASEWLTLRGGLTNYQEVFQPVTGGIRGEPVNYPIYALGCGIKVGSGVLNIAYEYSDTKYVDTWANAVSINRQITNTVVASFTYNLSWMK